MVVPPLPTIQHIPMSNSLPLSSSCRWPNSFVAVSHGHPDFEHPSHLFEAIMHHNGWTVGRNTTVLQFEPVQIPGFSRLKFLWNQPNFGLIDQDFARIDLINNNTYGAKPLNTTSFVQWPNWWVPKKKKLSCKIHFQATSLRSSWPCTPKLACG